MAQKKVTLELSIVELEHLQAAIAASQDEHQARLGRQNPALTRVEVKMAKAIVEYLADDKADVADKPADKADADEE